MRLTKYIPAIAAVVLPLISMSVSAAPVAEYSFNGNLNSNVGPAPSLVATDPLGVNGFVTDTVFGTTQTVYHFGGLATPLADQGGLSVGTAGLLTSANTYSVQMVFDFTQKDGAWRRILDVQLRNSDNGFYVDPSNHLDVYPVVSGGAAFTNNAYHNVVLVDNAGTVTGYLDGTVAFSLATTVMDNSSNAMNFFLDNLVGGGLGEWSDGNVALIRLYNEALTTDQALTLSNTVPKVGGGAVPEPASLALLGLGLAGLGLGRRKRA